MKKKDKIQEQESPPDLDSAAAAEGDGQGEAKGRLVEGQEASGAAASGMSLNGTPKHKKKKKKKKKMGKNNKMQEQQKSPPELNSMVAAEAKGRGVEGHETTDVAAPVLNGTPKCKVKKTKKKDKTQEQESPPDLDSMAAAEADDQGEEKGRVVDGQEATGAAASALNGAPNRKKNKIKRNNKMQEQHESSPELNSAAAAEAEEQGEAKGKGVEGQEATCAAAPGMCILTGLIFCLVALNETPKCKKKTKKKDKIQEQESPPDLDSMAAAEADEQGEAKGRVVEGQQATAAAASALNGTPKRKKKKMKNNNKLQEQQESLPELNSMVAAEAEELREAKGRGVEGQEVTDTAAPGMCLNGTPRSKKRKRKNNRTQEVHESPPEMNSMVVVVADEQGEAKGGGIEWDTTDAAASALNGTPRCINKKIKKNNKQERQETRPDLDSTAAAEAEEQGEAKGHGMEKQEATHAAASVLERTPKCDEEEANVKDSVMLKEEPTSTVVSASEGIPKRKKRKRKSKIQEQSESKQTPLGIADGNKIVCTVAENGCTDGVEASGHADVNMDPINGEDPSCAQSNANVAGVLINFSENNSLIQESSAGRKGQKKKGKKGRWPCFSSENDGMIGKNSLDSSIHHDLSCICASCLVEARKEKIKNIYSPRGSLVRFRRKKLLILDLNGLLADINQDFRNADKAHGKVRGKLVFRRPYCEDFLRFCFQNFELGIWSSRKRENVTSVVDIVLKRLKHYLLFCWDMSHCTVTGRNTIDNKHKPLVLKELKKLWNKEEPTLPWEQGEFSPSNTLLVDDSPYKALCNPPNTSIFPQPYSYRNEKDDCSLGPGGDLRIYLERIAAADDVQNFVRDNPFGQKPITESDPNWNFYVQIVDKVEKQVTDKVEKQVIDKVKKVEKQVITNKVKKKVIDKAKKVVGP
ncbi:hypothetical protein HU200_056742 [Digitaria exilis]|uniref:FCP1 homology domain-containing protein n=1 Tax=Digitaria exilis TaxID=1010633 RepID=A0A835AL05_9POAL|nr:hypothetical protein HU200_056742 [Digitaria exilis]